MTKPLVLDPKAMTPETGPPPSHPFAGTLGPFEARALGDALGLTHYGVNLETLPPGSRSSLRHWHTCSDEFVYVVSGTLTLVTDSGEATLPAGHCAGFSAGSEDGHHLINRSNSPATFLVVGSRVPGAG